MSWCKGHGVENVFGGSAGRGAGGVHSPNKGDIEGGRPGHRRGRRHQRGLRGGQREAGGGRGVGRVRRRGAQGPGAEQGHVVTSGRGGGLVRQRSV